MKKLSLLLISAFAISAFAAPSSISLKYGLSDLDDGFDNSTFSLDGVYDMGYAISPRLDLAYVNIDDSKKWGGVSSLLQLAISGQYEPENNYMLSPYLFGGLGYESVSDSTKCFDSNPFAQLGAGLKYAISDKINIVAEAKALQMLSGDNQDNEVVLSLGANMPFNSPVVAAAPTLASMSVPTPTTPTSPTTTLQATKEVSSTVVAIADQDGDGVPDEIDVCPNTVMKKDIIIGKNGCEIVILLDSDNDGVTDDIDQCKNTPYRAKVDENGCAKGETSSLNVSSQVKSEDNYADMGDKINLHINFDSNLATIKPESKAKIKKFADYIKTLGRDTIVIINGYTDSSGDAMKNRVLSRERAFAVRQALIKAGLKKSNVRAYGKGSANPIASNDTPEGRAQNRRIEAIIKH